MKQTVCAACGKAASDAALLKDWIVVNKCFNPAWLCTWPCVQEFARRACNAERIFKPSQDEIDRMHE